MPQGLRTALVYISEAHALDEWPILDTERGFHQHGCLEDRRTAATFTMTTFPQLRAQLFPGPDGVFLDDMSNAFDGAYASWPLRFWIISEDERIVYKAMPTDARYDEQQLYSHLDQAVAASTGQPVGV